MRGSIARYGACESPTAVRSQTTVDRIYLMTTDLFDVAVVGAGPAGATAAVLLAKQGRSVVLLDRRSFPSDSSYTTWLSAASIPLLNELGIGTDPFAKLAFKEISFYRSDFTQTAKPVLENPPGFLIDRADLDNMLISAVKSHEIALRQGTEVASIKQKESSVEINLGDGAVVEARLLIIASGHGSELAERVGVSTGHGGLMHWSAQIDAPLDGTLGSNQPQVGIVLGLDLEASFGTYYVTKDRVSVGVVWRGPKVKLIPTLTHLCQQGFEHKIVPVDLSEQGRNAKVLQGPTSYALDMDTHVGKHILVIGEAGGFIAAASHEGIYPAMWSAQIAAEVAGKALASVHSQDELMGFNSAWRITMAEYLRPPHTDIQFLLPLIFSHQPMADRMGAAFFLGENI